MTREEKEAMKDKAIHDAMCSIENRIRHVYNQGFEDGKDYYIQKHDNAYNKGLEDAWECARKIISDVCYDAKTLKQIFGTQVIPDIFKHSASEAVVKIKEYEEQKKQTEKSCDDCRFADLTAYEFPCSVCSASHTFRWEPRKGAEE